MRGPRPSIVLTVVSLDTPQARCLEAAHIAEMGRRYGGGGMRPADAAQFLPPGGCFAVALSGDAAVACGGFRRLSASAAELKRMFVRPPWRGRGVARRLLGFLEDCARDVGYAEMRLATGTPQPEAIALYESAGYRRIAGFGEFRDDPRSRHYARPLRLPSDTNVSACAGRPASQR